MIPRRSFHAPLSYHTVSTTWNVLWALDGRPTSSRTPRFVAMFVTDLGFAPSSAAMPSEVAIIEASWRPPLIYGVGIFVVGLVLAVMIFG